MTYLCQFVTLFICAKHTSSRAQIDKDMANVDNLCTRTSVSSSRYAPFRYFSKWSHIWHTVDKWHAHLTAASSPPDFYNRLSVTKWWTTKNLTAGALAVEFWCHCSALLCECCHCMHSWYMYRCVLFRLWTSIVIYMLQRFYEWGGHTFQCYHLFRKAKFCCVIHVH